ARYRLYSADVLRGASFALCEPFDLAFLDPPYQLEPAIIAAFLQDLEQKGLLACGAIASYEHAKSADTAFELAFEEKPWELLSCKHYGDTSIHILRKRS
ncbi:MAG: RsmD family RNA methyltransferase, partial [Eggerthellaceae bacterium]|nr:RsmD family RNA methyltransferase [Eggerthellaceae bacterium]